VQQTAFGRGQQPYSPVSVIQHVFPSGHCDFPSAQVTAPTERLSRSGFLVLEVCAAVLIDAAIIDPSEREQRPPA
jgi:hypothetical protein